MSDQPPATMNLNDFIRRHPVTAMKVSMQCPNCLKGELKYTGMSSDSQPKQFQHRCECGHEIGIVGKQFPSINFEDIPNDLDKSDGVAGRIGNQGGGEASLGPCTVDGSDPQQEGRGAEGTGEVVRE